MPRDLHEKKLKRIQSGAKRLDIDIISTAAADAREFQPELEDTFDLTAIADVPCSGLGIIRKKPDIRYKDLRETENLPEIQRAILSNLSRYVRPGGALVYSTCTVLRRENQAVVANFLSEHPDYMLDPFVLPGPCGRTVGEITLWPAYSRYRWILSLQSSGEQMAKIDLKSKTIPEIEAFLAELGEPKFRAKQVFVSGCIRAWNPLTR